MYTLCCCHVKRHTVHSAVVHVAAVHTVLLYTLLLYTRSITKLPVRSIIELPFNHLRTFNGSTLRGLYFPLDVELVVPLCKPAQTSGRSPGRFRVRVMPTWDRDFTQPGYVDALAVHIIIIVMIRSTFVIAIYCYSGAHDLVQPRLLGRSSWTAHRRSGAIVSGCAPYNSW